MSGVLGACLQYEDFIACLSLTDHVGCDLTGQLLSDFSGPHNPLTVAPPWCVPTDYTYEVPHRSLTPLDLPLLSVSWLCPSTPVGSSLIALKVLSFPSSPQLSPGPLCLHGVPH